MILFFISAILVLLFVFFIYNSLRTLSPLQKFLGLFLLTCAHLILALEIASLFGALNQPQVILLIQAGLDAAAFALNRVFHLGTPKLTFSPLKEEFKKILAAARSHRGLALFGAIILLTYAFLAFLEIRFPQNTSDALVNHLSRIAHWLQQGSVKTYVGVNTVGTTFPYNNSLLMLWSMVFLRTDILVGFVQFCAAFVTSITIYGMSRELGFGRRASLLAGLFFLTFPIVALESITAQNDLLVTSFLIAAFYFLVCYLHTDQTEALVLSILSFALAAGTKQAFGFAFPGYLLLFLFVLWKKRKSFNRVFKISAVCAVVFILLFSVISYLQNWISFGSPIGGGDVVELVADDSEEKNGFQKVVVNSLRLGYQFISCEGIPPEWQAACINAKANLLRPALTKPWINVETDQFLLEEESKFRLDDTTFALNEEASWFGFAGFILISAAGIYGIVYSIKMRKTEGLILVLTSVLYFFITSSVKTGWDWYVGRYLIFSSALLLPFAGGFLSDRGWLRKLALGLLCLLSVFIMLYSIVNNDSRPLLGKSGLGDVKWESLSFFQKARHNLASLLRHDRNVWEESDLFISAYAQKEYLPLLQAIDEVVPDGSSMGILNPVEYEFPEYLFFGDGLERKVYIFSEPEAVLSTTAELDYLIAASEFSDQVFAGFSELYEIDGWKIYQKNQT